MPLIDLHAHYPMHLLVRRASQTLRPHHDTHALMLRLRRRRLVDRLRALLLWIANRLFNYPRSGKPAVTIPNLQKGGVGVALSVIVVPYDEVGWKALHGAPPAPGSIKHVERQIRWVEKDLARKPDAAVAHNPQQLATIRAAGKIALIHAVEGGFLVGETVPKIQANVGELAKHGVAYVTVAHLFFRKVATNAPALPFLKDKTYECLFPQPAKGLCNLGIAAVEAMVDKGVLVDVTHMSERSTTPWPSWIASTPNDRFRSSPRTRRAPSASSNTTFPIATSRLSRRGTGWSASSPAAITCRTDCPRLRRSTTPWTSSTVISTGFISSPVATSMWRSGPIWTASSNPHSPVWRHRPSFGSWSRSSSSGTATVRPNRSAPIMP